MPGNMFIPPPQQRQNPIMGLLGQLALMKVQHDWGMEEKQLALEAKKIENDAAKAEVRSKEQSEARMAGAVIEKPSGPVDSPTAYQQSPGAYYEPRYGMNVTPPPAATPVYVDGKIIGYAGNKERPLTLLKNDPSAKLGSPEMQAFGEWQKQNPNGTYQQFAPWYSDLKKKEGVNINIADKGETAAARALGTATGEGAVKRIKMAQEGQTQNFQLDEVAKAIGQGAKTGWGAETVLDLRRAAESIGIDTGDLGPQELIRKTSNEMALRLRNPESGLGLTGNTSNQDLNFLKDSVVGLARTERGNMAIISSMKKMNQLKVDVAKEQSKILKENGGVPPLDLDERILKYVDNYKLFTPQEKKENKRLSMKVINTGVHKDGRKTVQLEDGTWEYAN